MKCWILLPAVLSLALLIGGGTPRPLPLAAASSPLAPSASVDVAETFAEHTLVEALTGTAGTGYAWFVQGPGGMVRWVAVNGRKNRIAFTGRPGTYTIMLVVLVEGGGLEQAWATTEIVADQPEPDPQPDPQPGPDPQPLTADRLYLIHETADDTPALAEVRAATTWKTRAEKLGMKWLMSDDDVARRLLPEVVAAAEKRGLPAVVFCQQEKVVGTAAVPATAAAMVSLVESYGGDR